jgi:hypothetical protein
MKKIVIMLPSILIITAFFTLIVNTNNSAHAVGFCPPICLDEVNDHVKGSIKALDKGDIITAKSEMNIVKSLLDQLKDMTTLKKE